MQRWRTRSERVEASPLSETQPGPWRATTSTKWSNAGTCTRQPEAGKGQRGQLQDDQGRIHALFPQEEALAGKGGEDHPSRLPDGPGMCDRVAGSLAWLGAHLPPTVGWMETRWPTRTPGGMPTPLTIRSTASAYGRRVWLTLRTGWRVRS